ncbi:hypothetical protein CAEBREN_18960 [Caenorhabditis brenneri]|uniref:Uncharacterized protein n=1 Tax=Caenorhabditis brenneri TaxID=135651 RepID=G0NK68_CAEBE|nr:hypothetical protein CAEBREN_18960 [Caenorhabditis brenneri]
MAENGFAAPPDPKILAMRAKVNEETALLDGDRSPSWALNAVQMLSRAARKNGCHDQFYEAVIREDSNTKCCPARNDKMKAPHGRILMFLLKLFRFPYLRHEFQIKSVLNCQHPYSLGSRDVCINPWHYRFLELKKIPVDPILVDKGGDFGHPPHRGDDAFQEHLEWEVNKIQNLAPDADNFHMPNVTMQGDEIKLLYERLSAAGGDGAFAYPVLEGNVAPFVIENSPSCSSYGTSSPSMVSSVSSSTQSLEMQDMYRSGMSSPASSISSPRLFRQDSNQDTDMENDEELDFDRTPRCTPNQHKNNGTPNPTFSDGTPIEPIEPRPLFRSSPSELGELVRNAANANIECVPYKEDPNWLRIAYYEETEKIGPTEQFCSHHCLIDGFSSSSEKLDPGSKKSRFSIGFYTNPNRSEATKDVRAHIGKGIRLFLLAGEVYVENLGAIPVFVQSISANMKNGFSPNTVTKLMNGGSMKVFDMKQFSDKLSQAAKRRYVDVHCLSRLCTIRLSFSKGWGEQYSRTSVLRAPVWFQVHLNNPMEWIDNVLNCMGAPPRVCSSRT